MIGPPKIEQRNLPAFAFPHVVVYGHTHEGQLRRFQEALELSPSRGDR